MKYYRLQDDINYPNRWYLGTIINDDDNWKYVIGDNIDNYSSELEAKVSQDGSEMDYTITNAYSVPIVSERIKNQLYNLSDIQFIPLKIVGRKSDLKYFIMVVANKIDCIDETKSKFNKFEVNDPVRPDLAGHYRGFFRLVLDESRIEGKDVFRINKAENYLIISDRVKEALQNISASGVKMTLLPDVH